MREFKTFWYAGEHHFLLTTGETFLGTPSGVWASYIPPKGGKKGTVMMLYATRESRFFVPHVLGALAVHSLNTYGELPEGSHDVSCHSIGIQRRLADLLGQLPASAVLNRENWFSSIRNIKFWSSLPNVQNTRILDLELLREGKEFILNVLKSPHAVQMELPFYQEV
jgi:hypothetical protein